MSKIDFDGNIFCKMKHVGSYADDIVIVKRNKNILKDTYLQLKKVVIDMELVANCREEKYST